MTIPARCKMRALLERVRMALIGWRAVDETSYLLSRPANARRLASAIHELDAAGGAEQGLGGR